MKTLLFTLEFPPFKGGVANYYGNLVKYWPRDEKILVLNNEEKKLNSGSGFLSWRRAYGELKRKVKISKIDYILVGQILPLGTVAYYLSWFQPIKYAVFLHGLDWTLALKSKRKRFLSKLIIKRADKIICANTYVAQQVKEFYPQGRNKIRVLNPGIRSSVPEIDSHQLQTLKETYHLDNKITLFSLGRLIERKGFDQVIKALIGMSAEYLDKLVYFIAGSGSYRKTLEDLIPPFLASKIIFLGNLSNEEKWLWLKQADIFIMPARQIDEDFEGFGIVYLEANISSCPVIAGRSGGVEDAVIDNYNGLLVNPLDVQEIKEAIIKLMTNPELGQKLGEQGKKRALSQFIWEKQVSKLVEIIKEEE